MRCIQCTRLGELLVASNDLSGAKSAVTPLLTAWPVSPLPLRWLARVAELEGALSEAVTLRSRALAVSGDDVTLARVVASDAGKPLLDWAKRDGLAAIRAFQASSFRPNAPAIQVLDAGALQVEAGGRSVERVHSIVQVLDKRGIDRHGEVSVPGDAQALVVRAIKPDGTLREAENIAGKDAISLPGLEPGDFVEVEYLRAQEPSAPAFGGWLAGPFSFRAADLPFFESTYRVRVHSSLGLDVDSANLALPAVRADGDWLVFEHTAKEVDAWVGEPMSIAETELLPWVQVGKGPSLENDVRLRGDWQSLRLRVTPEVDALVDGLSGLAPREKVRQVLARIIDAVPGDGSSNDFAQTAPAILAARRGNRSVVFAAALDALGIDARFVVAIPFGSSEHPFKFSRSELLGLTFVRVRLPDGETLWFDPASKFAPFGRLSFFFSGLTGYVVPRPGEAVTRVQLPEIAQDSDRLEGEYALSVDAEGTATGTVLERHVGFSGTSRRRAIERSNPEEFRKAQERTLANGLRGVELVSVEPRDPGDLEKPFVVQSSVRVPRFVRPSRVAGAVEAPGVPQPFRLGAALLSAGERKTPMLFGTSYSVRVSYRVSPPPGARAVLPAPVESKTRFGHYLSAWTVSADGAAQLTESLDLFRQRIPPADYAAFREFVSGIDAAQARPIVFEPIPAAVSPPPAPASP